MTRVYKGPHAIKGRKWRSADMRRPNVKAEVNIICNGCNSNLGYTINQFHKLGKRGVINKFVVAQKQVYFTMDMVSQQEPLDQHITADYVLSSIYVNELEISLETQNKCRNCDEIFAVLTERNVSPDERFAALVFDTTKVRLDRYNETLSGYIRVEQSLNSETFWENIIRTFASDDVIQERQSRLELGYYDLACAHCHSIVAITENTFHFVNEATDHAGCAVPRGLYVFKRPPIKQSHVHAGYKNDQYATPMLPQQLAGMPERRLLCWKCRSLFGTKLYRSENKKKGAFIVALRLSKLKLKLPIQAYPPKHRQIQFNVV